MLTIKISLSGDPHPDDISVLAVDFRYVFTAAGKGVFAVARNKKVIFAMLALLIYHSKFVKKLTFLRVKSIIKN